MIKLIEVPQSTSQTFLLFSFISQQLHFHVFMTTIQLCNILCESMFAQFYGYVHVHQLLQPPTPANQTLTHLHRPSVIYMIKLTVYK